MNNVDLGVIEVYLSEVVGHYLNLIPYFWYVTKKNKQGNTKWYTRSLSAATDRWWSECELPVLIFFRHRRHLWHSRRTSFNGDRRLELYSYFNCLMTLNISVLNPMISTSSVDFSIRERSNMISHTILEDFCPPPHLTLSHTWANTPSPSMWSHTFDAIK